MSNRYPCASLYSMKVNKHAEDDCMKLKHFCLTSNLYLQEIRVGTTKMEDTRYEIIMCTLGAFRCSDKMLQLSEDETILMNLLFNNLTALIQSTCKRHAQKQSMQ